MSGMKDSEIDTKVLEALRALAEGVEKRIAGKIVKQAGSKDGTCLYVRIVREMRERGVEIEPLTLRSMPRLYKTLQESLGRLRRQDLIFDNGGRGTKIDERSYWVVMS